MKTQNELDRAMKRIRTIANARVFDRDAYRACEKLIVSYGLCPSCVVSEGKRRHLSSWEPGNSENYAGRECAWCQEFFRCGEQPEYDQSPDCFSDADPGL